MSIQAAIPNHIYLTIINVSKSHNIQIANQITGHTSDKALIIRSDVRSDLRLEAFSPYITPVQVLTVLTVVYFGSWLPYPYITRAALQGIIIAIKQYM